MRFGRLIPGCILTLALLLLAASCDKEGQIPLPPSHEQTDDGGEEPGGETPGGEEPGGDNPGGEEPGGDNPGGEEPGGDEPGGTTPDPGETTPPAVIDYDLSVLDRPLGEVRILTSGAWLQNNSVMQSFVLPGDGTLYAVQVAASGTKYKLNLTRRDLGSNDNKTRMQLSYFGHGSNIDFERKADGTDYIWLGSYGTNTYYKRAAPDNVHITESQTITRVRYEAGRDLRPEDLEEHWYIPGAWNVHPSIDWERRQIAVFGYLSNPSRGFFRVYDLDEALALPKKEVTLARQIVRGPGDDYPLTPQSYQATVHDLSDLTPLADISLTSDAWSGWPYNFGTGDNQGFLLHAGRIYHFHGGGNDGNPSEAVESVVTVFDFSGKILGQHRVMAVASIPDLAAAGLTDYGFMESEGIKICDGSLCLGYATKKTGDNHRYVTILQYPLSRKP